MSLDAGRPAGSDAGGSEIRIVVTGDVSDDGLPPFEVGRIPGPVRRLIESSDLLVTNLEGPIRLAGARSAQRFHKSALVDRLLQLGLRAAKKERSIVCSSPQIMELFSLAAETCVTLANNHINDLGPEGVADTIRCLAERGAAYVGAGLNREEANAPRLMQPRGKRVVVLNYNFVGLRKFGVFVDLHGARHDRPGAAYLPVARIGRLIRRIRAESPATFVLLVVHAGRVLARTLEETGVDHPRFERLGAHCVVFHHSHRWFGPARGQSFFLGDFVFRQPRGIDDDRLGGFLELRVNPDDNSFRCVPHVYRFEHGYPRLEPGA